MMKLTYDDVLIVPQFSDINSRADVSIKSFGLDVPVISANMDTVTESNMARAMVASGGVGALHRFCDVDDNLFMYQESPDKTFCSVGLGDAEKYRAKQLHKVGCTRFILDVAHGAQQQVVDQAKYLLDCYGIELIVGNFASPQSVEDFLRRTNGYNIAAFKVGIGPGAACTTRIKTGVGYPQLSAIMECSKVAPVIADGGIKTAGDVAKALAAGAQAVMIGKLLAGTYEASGGRIDDEAGPIAKQYRGSASKESYRDQGKNSDWITAEGASGYIELTGSVKDVMNDIAGGLRSSLTYVGARDMYEFRKKAQFIEVSGNTVVENGSRL